MLACTSTANSRRSKPNEELNSAKAGSVSPLNRPPQRFVFVLSLTVNRFQRFLLLVLILDFVVALIRLTWLHDSGYFMHLCGENATIMHCDASECPTNFSLSLGWQSRRVDLKGLATS